MLEELRNLPAPIRAAGETLLEKFDLRHASGDWSSRFSKTTLHYPRLQTHGIVVDDDAVEMALNGHLMLLLHTFLEDRLLDGQIAFTRAEAMFVKQMLIDGMDALRIVAGSGHERFREWQLRIHREYIRAQAARYLIDGTPSLRAHRVCRIASGRASLGFAATLALLCRYNVGSETLRAIKNTYDCFVTGLQWADDIADWSEDLANRDENLALLALGERGLDPYAHPPNYFREANVGHALIDRDVLGFASEQARRWFQHAIVREQRLGCHDLAKLIHGTLPLLEFNVQLIKSDIDREVRTITRVAEAAK